MNEKLTLADCFKYPNAMIQFKTDEIRRGFIRNIFIKEDRELEIECFPISFYHQSTSACKLILRPLSDLTDEESFKYQDLSDWYGEIYLDTIKSIDYLRSINIDIDGFIEAGKAVAE